MGPAFASPQVATTYSPSSAATLSLTPITAGQGSVTCKDDVSVDAIGALMAVDVADLHNARRLLALLGDPGRRTIIEQLSLRPATPGKGLPDIMGMNSPNVYHRLRSLRYNGVIYCDKDHIYHVDPAPLRSASRYFDVLTVASSLMAPIQGALSNDN